MSKTIANVNTAAELRQKVGDANLDEPFQITVRNMISIMERFEALERRVDDLEKWKVGRIPWAGI